MRGMSNSALVQVSRFTSITQNEDFRDTYSNYREVIANDGSGDSLGYAIVAGPLPFNWHRTPNYDIPMSLAGQSKEDNIFTANNAACGPGDDLQSQDYVLVLDFRGHPDWGMVDGALKFDTMANRNYCYVVPTNPPVILEGAWASYN